MGVPLARRLAAADASLKLSDVDGSRLGPLAEELDAERVAPDAVDSEPCDIFAPCAVSGVLNARTIPDLRCRVVAGSANSQLETPADAERLRDRDILYAPDFIINAGGAIHHGGLGTLGMDMDEVERRIAGIGETLTEIFEEAASRGETPLAAAERRAERILARGPSAQASG